MDYRPLIITAHLATPIVCDRFFNIDGVLLSLACEQALGVLDSQRPAVSVEFDPALSPLRIIQWDGGWMYQSSSIQREIVVRSQNFFTRRHNETEAEILSTRRQWDSSRGDYRNAYYRYEQTHSPTMSWQVVGDKKRILQLLSGCDAIGKYRYKGSGQISQWVVADADADDTTFGLCDNGNPIRPVPLSYATSNRILLNIKNRIGRVAYRPPYWDVSNYKDCYLP